MLQPGSRIGRYEIQRKLARGGMGTVYVAHDPVLGRMVALKVFLGDLDVPDAAERFAREARAAAALNHANIVTIFDFGEVDSQPYIVMEYIQGETLAEFITRKTAVPLIEKLRWLEELCAGVASAHKMDVVHRDIKPSNLIIDKSGRLKILDFGIAKLLGSIGSSVTAVIGTPGYMAPEQLLGQPVDGRTDLFSIGIVAFELLTYREAFSGDTFTAITHRIINEDVRHLSEFLPEAPPDLCDVVARSVQKDPALRYQDADSLRIQLGRVRRQLESHQDYDGNDAPTIVSPIALPIRKAATGAGTAEKPAFSSIRTAELTPPPNPTIQREAQARARASQIAATLQRGEGALRDGQLDAAREACQQVRALEPGHTAVADLERRIQEVQARLEAAHLIDDARTELARGALTRCRTLLEQARDLDPQARDPQLERDLRMARAEQERLRHRAESVARTLTSAREALDRGDDEAALAWAREALALAPDSEEASALESQAVANLQEITERGMHDAPEPPPLAPPLPPPDDYEADAPTIVASMPRLTPQPSARHTPMPAGRPTPPPQARHTPPPVSSPRATAAPPLVPPDLPPVQMPPSSMPPSSMPGDLADDAPTIVTGMPLPTSPRAASSPPRASSPSRSAAASAPAPMPATPMPAPAAAPPKAPPAARPTPTSTSAPARPASGTLTPTQQLIVVGVVVFLVLLVGALLLWRALTPGPAAAARGALVVEALPWANVTAITDGDGVNQLTAPAATPLSTSVPVGRYTVTFRGPANAERSITVEVGADGVAVAPVVRFEDVTGKTYFEKYFPVTTPTSPAADAAEGSTPGAAPPAAGGGQQP
jgi:tetratricopeptide (TPR) repeat protein/predicted Ser/Thr protein kinase